MILAASLYNDNGIKQLFSKTKIGLTEPANFRQYTTEARFKELRRWSQFAFASDAEIKRTDDPRCEMTSAS